MQMEMLSINWVKNDSQTLLLSVQYMNYIYYIFIIISIYEGYNETSLKYLAQI